MFKYLIILVLISLTPMAEAGPNYASDKTRSVIEGMLEAHGGLAKWQDAPAIHFDNIMHNNFAGPQEFAWWVARESFDQKTRHVYQNWSLDDATLAFDGEQVWSQNYQRGNPPEFSAYFFYYFVNLPWLTQDDNVVLGEVRDFEWPGTGQTFHEVHMGFSEAPTIGKTAKDYFVLYIDKTTSRLVGYQYAIGYRPMLDVMGQPPERELFGPLWRLITRYETVDGLLFPAAFRTMPEPGERIVGNHVILNIDITTPFDEAQLNAPKGAATKPLATLNH